MEDAAKDPIEPKADLNGEESLASAEPTAAMEQAEASDKEQLPDRAPVKELQAEEADGKEVLADEAGDHGEESVESEEEAAEELPDFVSMNTEDLVGLAIRSLKERPVSDLRSLMEGIQAVVQERFETVYEENKQLFLERRSDKS